MLLVAILAKAKRCKKAEKSTETLLLVLWTKVALALEVLKKTSKPVNTNHDSEFFLKSHCPEEAQQV